MTDDKELADAVVAIPLGPEKWQRHSELHGFYYRMGTTYGVTAEDFVRDWRVAGPLMEKCLDREIVLALITDEAMRNLGESLPLAITEACVEILK